MSTVNIEVDSRWVKRTRSPLYWVVGSVQGVAMTFIPPGLYLAGRPYPKTETDTAAKSGKLTSGFFLL